VRRLALAPVLALCLVVGACGDDGDGSADAAQYCSIGAEIFAVNGQLGAAGDAFNALGDTATPQDVADFRAEGRALLIEFHRLLEAGAAVAPDEIRDAAVVLADAFAPVDDEGATGPAANPFDEPEVQEANDRVVDWAAANC
jgi:hypothetical protein